MKSNISYFFAVTVINIKVTKSPKFFYKHILTILKNATPMELERIVSTPALLHNKLNRYSNN